MPRAAKPGTRRGTGERRSVLSRLQRNESIPRLLIGLFSVGLLVVLIEIEWVIGLEATTGGQWAHLAGTALVVLLVALLFGLYAGQFERESVRSSTAVLALGALFLIPAAAAKVFPLLEVPVYLIPLAAVTLVYALVTSRQGALFFALMASVLVALAYSSVREASHLRVVPEAQPLELTLTLLAGALTAVFLSARIRKRSTLLQIGVAMAVVHVWMVCGWRLARIGQTGAWRVLLQDGLWAAVGGVGTGILLTVFLPIIEYLSGTVTDIRLLELSDQNHPLLREMVMHAPGTYHHSQILGNLCEAAAEAIGAHSLLARVAAYYHDIGKLTKPEYFVENAGVTSSPHEKISPAMSSLIISAHTKDGLELGREYKLPKPILEIIQQHHGTTLIEYFYREAIEDPEKRDAVREEFFRHHGPKPLRKEAAIMMLADACESASRTLDEPTPTRIEKLVHELVYRRLMDGQLDECGLTLTDVKKIEQSLVRGLTGVLHRRVKYPSQLDEERREQEAKEQAQRSAGQELSGA